MAFTEIKTEGWKRPRLVNQVNMRTDVTGTAAFTISEDVLKRLGNPSFLSRLVGSGEHAGMVCFLPKQMPGKATAKLTGIASGKSKQISFPCRLIGLEKLSRSSRPVPFEITEDGLIVDYCSMIDGTSAISPTA
jgi:hypothetical protein